MTFSGNSLVRGCKRHTPVIQLHTYLARGLPARPVTAVWNCKTKSIESLVRTPTLLSTGELYLMTRTLTANDVHDSGLSTGATPLKEGAVRAEEGE